MTHTFDSAGNLVISADSEERDALLKTAQGEGFHSDEVLYEIFERFIANSEFDWCQPEDIGALTAAPILATYDKDGEVVDAYGFMDYAVRSVQQDLLERGQAIFTKG